MTLLRKTIPVGMLRCNCTILGDAESGEALVIDPGDEVTRILAEVRAMQLRVVGIVHTHAHIDHIGGAAELAQQTEAPVYLHPDDTFLHQMLHVQAAMLGLEAPEVGVIDRALRDEVSVPFGQYELGTLHTPGHSPGSVCFCVSGHELCFSGDTLFQGGIGRTDLWGGDADQIVKSIRQKLYTLQGAVEVVPGHGPVTHIDAERSSNPFVKA